MAGFDNLTWVALGAVLTAVGLGVSWVVYRRRGLVAGLRAAAWSLLPLAAGLTRTFRLVAEIGAAFASWAVHLVFSPFVWLGLGVFALSLALFAVSGLMRRAGRIAVPGRGTRRQVDSTQEATKTTDAGDMDDIEAILRKHGIQ